MTDQNRYPKGWDKKRVERLLDFYESQTDEEAVAEHEEAHESRTTTLMAIPHELVPEVRKLLSRKRVG